MIYIIRFLILAILGTSCSSVSYSEIFTIGKNVLVPNDFIITEDFISQQKFSFIKVSFGRNSNAIFVLSKINPDGSLRWVSSNQEIIITLKGKILELVNISHDYKIYGFDKNFNDSDKEYFIHYPRLNTSIEVKSSLTNEVDIDGVSIKEDVFVKTLDWKFQNTYKFNSSGVTTYSKQKIFPNSKHVEIYYYFKY